MSGSVTAVAPPAPREARHRHLPGIAALIGENAARGRMLPRSDQELQAALPDFLVVEDESGGILATGALRLYETGNAEIICLAVQDDCRGSGFGRAIVEALTRRARARHVPRLFALTLEPSFFARMGFRPASFAAIPEKVRRDCLTCRFRFGCREIPVMMNLPADRPVRALR